MPQLLDCERGARWLVRHDDPVQTRPVPEPGGSAYVPLEPARARTFTDWSERRLDQDARVREVPDEVELWFNGELWVQVSS
jgi:hypothetical protein